MLNNSLVTMLKIAQDNNLMRVGEAYAAFAALAAPLDLNKLHKEMASVGLVYKDTVGQYQWYFDAEKKVAEDLFFEITGERYERGEQEVH